jgi:hypothetical protein
MGPQDARNLTVDPPSDSAFTFSMADFSSTAIVLLKLDPRLSQIRFEMVPKVYVITIAYEMDNMLILRTRDRLKEDVFFRNYAYRVHLLQQQALLEHPPSTEYTASLSPVVNNKEGDSERTEVSYDAVEEEADWEAALEAEIARSDTEVLYDAKEDEDEIPTVNDKTNDGTKEDA